MGRFNVVAINRTVLGFVFLGLLSFVMVSLFTLAANGYISLFSVLAVLVPALLFYLYIKRHFAYRLSLELLGDRFTISKEDDEQEVFFSDVDYYKVETVSGIHLQIRLKNRKWIKILSTGDFGSDPEVLEQFLNQFEEQLKVYQRETPDQVRRKKTFYETRAGYFFALSLTIIGVGALILGFVTGKATVTSTTTLIVCILTSTTFMLVKKRD